MFSNSSPPERHQKRENKNYLQGVHNKLPCQITRVIPKYPNKDKSQPIEYYLMIFEIIRGQYKDHIHIERYNLNQAWKMVYLAKACGITCPGEQLPVNFDPIIVENKKVMLTTKENEKNGKTYTNLCKVWPSEDMVFPDDPVSPPNHNIEQASPEMPFLKETPIQNAQSIPIQTTDSASTVNTGMSKISESLPQIQEGGFIEKEDIF